MPDTTRETMTDLLAAGVLQSVVQWKVEDRPESEYYGLIHRRFPNAFPQSIEGAINRGLQAFKVGQSIEGDLSIGSKVLPNIPVNPDRPAKYNKPRLRFQYRVTVGSKTNKPGGTYVTVFVQSGKILSAEEIRAKAKAMALELYAQEDDKDPYKIRPNIADIIAIIVSAERTW